MKAGLVSGNPPLALEVFSGVANLSRSLADSGFDVHAWDILDNPHNDILDAGVLELLASQIRDRKFALIWIATPCQTFSAARRGGPDGPPPLRSNLYPMGLPNLPDNSQKKVCHGNLLLEASIKLLDAAHASETPFVLENPLTSRLWSTPPVESFLQRAPATLSTVHFCQYHVPWKKPTRLLHCQAGALAEILRLCQGKKGICNASGKPHLPLVGRDPTGTFWTLRAQPYPKRFCQDVAKFIWALQPVY